MNTDKALQLHEVIRVLMEHGFTLADATARARALLSSDKPLPAFLSSQRSA